MLKATLQFTCLNELWKFKASLQKRNLTILTKLNVLIGELSEEEIAAACHSRTATIINQHAVKPVFTKQY